MIGYIQYGEYRYTVLMSVRFGSWRLYLKPFDAKSAMFAETLPAVPDLLPCFEEDWVYARYRLDVEPGVKFNTTMANMELASRVSVALCAANSLVMQEHSRQSHGEFQSIWQASVDVPDIKATLTNKLGLLSSFDIHTPDLDFVMVDDDDDTPVPATVPDFVKDPQMMILQREGDKSPLFNSLNKETKRIYSLTLQYRESLQQLGIEIEAPKRTGYFSVNLSKKLEVPGAQYLKSKVTKSAVNMGVYQTIEDVREAHPDKNTAWIEKCNYVMVTDDNMHAILASLWSAPVVSFDTETTGLNVNFYSREGLADELVGVCLSPAPGTGYYFPLQHKLFKNLCGGDHRYFMQNHMKELLETKDIVCHNLSYDWKVAYIYDINVNCIFDTMLAFGVTHRYERSDCPLGLKAICSRLFAIDMFEIEDFVIAEWKNTDITFADLPYDLVAHYGPADADITLRVYYWCKENKLLERYGAQRVFDLEVNFSKAVAYSEFWGYHIDIDKIPALEEEIVAGMEREKAELFRIAGKEFNPNSSVQLSKIMYEELYPEILSDGIIPKATTAKETLWELDEYKTPDGEPRYPFVRHLLEYRKYETTYKNFLKKKDIYISPEGFVFPKVQQLGTNTGRLSIHEPNYQSYNDVVKKKVTGRPGFYIYDCDFAQIEYRVLASMAGQDALIKAFDDPDLDYHTHQAARMFSLPYAAVTKQLRQQSKGINFGLPYGMGDESLGKRVFGARTRENTAKAADLRRRFFDGQENILHFFERVRAQGVNSGFTETWLGRRRYYHKDQFSVSSIRRQAGNHVIQGCLDGDVRIQTKEFGIVNLKDVVGNTLTVWDGEDWTNGTITYSGKKRKCIVHFKGGQSIVCSPDHKFLIASDTRDTFIPCGSLTTEHRVCTNQINPCPNTQGIVMDTPALQVERVEITDEYIDMYDVCNTERGYFVADGIVTHNSAADIWKMAVTRFFNRIVKEGWLGLVLLDCFVHDELMGELSVELDPYEFIKAWREEYELVIDKFCRLYAGFGWGNSWYEAKKADYPPYFIDSLVAKADEHLPWDGDYKTLITNTKKDMYDYETKRVSDWLISVPQGTILAPHIGGYLYDKVGDWWEDILTRHPEYADCVLKKNKKKPDAQILDLDAVIQLFCEHEGIEFKPGWIKSPDDTPTKGGGGTPSTEEDATMSADEEMAYNQMVCERVYQMGFYLDTSFMRLYMRFTGQEDLNQFGTLFAKAKGTGDLSVYILSFDENGVATCHPHMFDVGLADFNAIQLFLASHCRKGV